MATQPPTSARIEDLKARLRLDPKSRLFYPLAEDLRKAGRTDEAEKVLRDGLEHHGTYLSAWMSLGRVLVEKGEHREATDMLMRALALDPGNVVCARLLANSYLAMGEKLEAVKKFKLVRALLPADEEVEEQIERLEKELEAENAGTFPPPAPPPAMPSEPVRREPSAASIPSAAAGTAGPPIANDAVEAEPFAEAPPLPELEPPLPPEEPTTEPEGHDIFADTPDSERAVPEGSWQNPFAARTPETQPHELESPTSRDEAPPERLLTAEEPFSLDQGTGSPEEPREEDEAELPSRPDPEARADETIATLTMADLYARQGHVEPAREIYRKVLERDPGNEQVREKLERLSAGGAPAGGDRRTASVERLERWLGKVGRRDV